MKTSRYPLRAAINSELFHPRTERDGIYLEEGKASQSAENRPRFELGCEAFGPLMEYTTRQDVPNLPRLLTLTVPANLESVADEWLKATMRARVVNDLAGRPVFATCDGRLIALGDAAIPFAEPEVRQGLWKLCSALKDVKASLPPEDDVDAWNEAVSSWASFTDRPPERSGEVWTLGEDCFLDGGTRDDAETGGSDRRRRLGLAVAPPRHAARRQPSRSRGGSCRCGRSGGKWPSLEILG